MTKPTDRCHQLLASKARSPGRHHVGILGAIKSECLGDFVGIRKPVERKLTGHVKRAVELIEEWLASGKANRKPLRFTDVAKSIGMQSRDFTRDVRNHEDFIDAIAELGVIETGPGKRFTAFAVAP